MESDAHQDIGGRDLGRPMRRISRHQLARMVARRPLAQPLFTMPESLRRVSSTASFTASTPGRCGSSSRHTRRLLPPAG